ncbi:MAG: insulinase family protein [Clostridia bacterium]|nr:insulinase family protein [Clostridia bacterium]
MQFKVNDLFHGFRVTSVTYIDEISADMIRMEFEKNGAELIWLDRDDDNSNKTFGIAFRTPPDDDTGVFHILEHSVLCGSENFPVKEPFVDLLKSSVHTFLNAMTYPDKTVYPVASRNDQDFFNLTRVYLDAVFKPLCVRRPLAFRQEGWHWEIGDDGRVTCNGVVYNEMKGAYASADRMMGKRLMKLLFPDVPYSFESGGDPEHIGELTYEKFCAQHAKYYSPSNARIFIDGKIDLELIFGLIESYLSEWEKVDVDSSIQMQTPVCPPEEIGYFPVGAEEDTEGRTMACDGWVFADCTDTVKATAASILFDVLAGSNSSPLTKAVLDSGLAEDVSLWYDGGLLQGYAVMSFKNIKEEDREKLRKIALDVIEKTIREGVDREELIASLNSTEFAYREQDYGRTPKGLAYCLDMLDTWLYGEDPAIPLRYEEKLAFLRRMAAPESRYYEDLLKEIFVDCTHKASVCMIPSRTLTAERDAAEAERCEKAAQTWTAADRKKVEDDLAELRRFQKTPDSPEAVASVPLLKLSDIPAADLKPCFEVGTVGGRTLLRHTQNNNGIIYGRVFFDMRDLSEEELHAAAFLSEVLGQIGTRRHGAAEIQRIIKRDLGDFGTSTAVYNRPAPDPGYAVVFNVSFMALEVNKDRIIPIFSEILNETDFSLTGEILNILKQDLLAGEKAVAMRGNAIASGCAAASLSESANVKYILSGMSRLRWMQKIKAENSCDNAAAELAAVAAKIFSRSRVAVSLTGPADDRFAEELLASLGDAFPPAAPVSHGLREKVNEGIEIPAAIGFAGRAGLMDGDMELFSHAVVASHFITYDYLWNEIRVNGGAYGTGMSVSNAGLVTMTSYRDPQPGRSVGVFDSIPEKLRELADGGDFEKYIISSLPSADPLLSSSARTARDDSLWLAGLPADYPSRYIRAILSTTAGDLRRIADAVEKALPGSAVCVVGGKETLEKCGGLLERITPVKQ